MNFENKMTKKTQPKSILNFNYKKRKEGFKMFADIKDEVKEILVDLFDVDQEYLQSQVKELVPDALTEVNKPHISIKDL